MKNYKNSARTEKWIREAFASLIIEKKSIDRIKLSEIIERADISKPTFYYHYKDLDDLVRSLENEMIDELSLALDEISKNPDPSLERCASLLFEFLKENEDEYRAFANASDLNYFIAKIKKIFAKKLDDPIFGFSVDSKVRSIQRVFISGAIVDTVTEYFKGSIQAELKDVNDAIMDGIKKLKA